MKLGEKKKEKQENTQSIKEEFTTEIKIENTKNTIRKMAHKGRIYKCDD